MEKGLRVTIALLSLGLSAMLLSGRVTISNASTEGPDQAAAVAISGMVFDDLNRNAVREPNEPPIPGVSVSDQVDVVATDRDGSYTISNSHGYGIVFVSVPDGYSAVGKFWRVVPAGQGLHRIDFALHKRNPADPFTFIHASDTHLEQKSLPRIRKLREVVSAQQPDFVIITGDLVRDALRVGEQEATSYYEMYLKEIGEFPRPVWNVPGNHEMFGIERHLSLVSPQHPLYGKKMYRHYLGPDYYSFNYGGVHFIGLDSIDIDDRSREAAVGIHPAGLSS